MKNVKRLVAFVVVIAMAIALTPVDGGVTSAAKKTTKKFKATKNMTFTDKNVSDLGKALKNKKVKTITLNLKKTKDLVIPKGDYSTKKLIVNSPKTSIVNKATFDTVRIDSIAPDTWTEKGNGNSLCVMTSNKVHIKVDTNKRVAAILFGLDAKTENALAKNTKGKADNKKDDPADTHTVEVLDGSVSSVVVDGNVKPVAVKTSGDSTVGTIAVESKGANLDLVAGEESHIKRVELAEKAGSDQTKVTAVAKDDAVIDQVTNKAEGAALKVEANGNATVSNVKVVGGASADLSGDSKKQTTIDLSQADTSKAIVSVEKEGTKIETAKGQDVSNIVDNKTGKDLDTKEKVEITEDTPATGGKKPGGGSGGGSGGGGAGDGGAAAGHAIGEEVTGSTAYVASAGAHVLEENLENCGGANLPSGNQDVRGKHLNVTVVVKNVSVAAGHTAPKLLLAAMSDGWNDWYATPDRTVTVQAAEKTYNISLPFDSFYSNATTPNPKYYRMRFRGEGATLTYKITRVAIEDNAVQDAPEQGTGSGAAADGNYLRNTSFAGDEWSNYINEAAAASVAFANGVATATITNAGSEDWHIQIKQTGLGLTKNNKYKFTATITSTAARRVKLAIMQGDSTWCGGVAFNLAAGENNISKVIELNGGSMTDGVDCAFQLSLGKMYDESQNPRVALDTPASTITISNPRLEDTTEAVSGDDAIVQGSGSGGNGESGSGSQTGENNTQEEVTAVQILQNVSPFTVGENTAWGDKSWFATGSVNDNKVTCNITDSQTNIWDVQLDQNVTLRNGYVYEIEADAKLLTDGSKTIQIGIQKNRGDYATYSEKLVELTGTTTHISFGLPWDQADTNAAKFFINMGRHANDSSTSYQIEYSNVKVTQRRNIATNSSFINSADGWGHWEEIPGNASYSIVDGKPQFTIIGDSDNDYSVQLKQTMVPLQEGKRYKLVYKAKSTSARTIKTLLQHDGGSWTTYSSELTDFAAGEEKEVSIDVDLVGQDDQVNYQINMGKVREGQTQASVITIYYAYLVEVE